MTRTSQKTPGTPPISRWMWLLIGFSLGIATAMAIQSNSHQATDNQTARGQEAESSRGGILDAGKTPPRHFDFYTLLPELKAIDSDPSPSTPSPSRTTAAQTQSPSTPTQSSPVDAVSYLLQAGSFKKYKEADSMKANLALLGVEANIQTVNVDQATWHRVQIGPYRNLGQVESIRQRLRNNQIDTLLVKTE